MTETVMTEAEARALVEREKARGRRISEGHQRRKVRLNEARALLEKAERERLDAEARGRSQLHDERVIKAATQLRQENPNFDSLTAKERRRLILERLQSEVTQ